MYRVNISCPARILIGMGLESLLPCEQHQQQQSIPPPPLLKFSQTSLESIHPPSSFLLHSFSLSRTMKKCGSRVPPPTPPPSLSLACVPVRMQSWQYIYSGGVGWSGADKLDGGTLINCRKRKKSPKHWAFCFFLFVSLGSSEHFVEFLVKTVALPRVVLYLMTRLLWLSRTFSSLSAFQVREATNFVAVISTTAQKQLKMGPGTDLPFPHEVSFFKKITEGPRHHFGALYLTSEFCGNFSRHRIRGKRK